MSNRGREPSVRAGVFIGVDKTGGLQKLNDAAAGARRMYNWAIGQGFTAPGNATLITDADRKVVRPDQIYDAIAALVNGPGVDQLIIYFAGHGVNINRGERWLLTEAPERTSAAVNVAGSVELARYCGIRHVVLFSDACRVAADGIQAQNVLGQDIFPNLDGAGDRAKPVDQFYACTLGGTAAEIKDPRVAATNYTALYTGALLDALDGLYTDILEPSTEAGDGAQYVTPRKLQGFLEREVPRRVREMQLERKVNQNPDAIITSDKSWLSRIELPVDRALGATRGLREPPPPVAVPASVLKMSDDFARSLPSQFTYSLESVETPHDTAFLDMECGISVQGNQIVDFVGPRVSGQIIDSDASLLRISNVEGPAASVLLRFQGDVGAVIPVIPGFLAGLTFDENELVDVTYMPSHHSQRWSEYVHRAGELLALRTVAASLSRQGRFRLAGADAPAVAQRMQYAKGVDPTLAVYAAYAYHGQQAIERIVQMSDFLRRDVGATFFDLALLSRSLVGKAVLPSDPIVPFAPMLSQGWALLSANRVRLPQELAGIEQSVQDSLWTLFDARGVDRIANVMLSGGVR